MRNVTWLSYKSTYFCEPTRRGFLHFLIRYSFIQERFYPRVGPITLQRMQYNPSYETHSCRLDFTDTLLWLIESSMTRLCLTFITLSASLADCIFHYPNHFADSFHKRPITKSLYLCSKVTAQPLRHMFQIRCLLALQPASHVWAAPPFDPLRTLSRAPCVAPRPLPLPLRWSSDATPWPLPLFVWWSCPSSLL